MVPTCPLIVALDFSSASKALQLAQQLNPQQCRVKVGKELFTAAGPELVHQLQHLGFDVFLDLKFHDIPATVAKAVKAAAQLGVWMLNVHASGGRKMLEEAANALANTPNKPLLIAVTMLTSLSQQDFTEIGGGNLQQQVLRLAQLSAASGLDGVVCSAQEASLLQQALGADFLKITPGIRPLGASAQDQTRIMTPSAALQAGSHYLVVGRPITQAAHPAQALSAIQAEIAAYHAGLTP